MMKKGQLSFFLMALFFFMNMPPHIGLAETNASIEVEGIIGNQPVDVTDKNDASKSPIVQHKEPNDKIRQEMPELGADAAQAQVFLMLGLLCLSGAIFVYWTRKYQGEDGNQGTASNATKKVEP